MEILKTVDTWFLILAVTVLAFYFVWSIRNVFQGFKEAVDELKSLIEKLFDQNGNHESRLSALEGRCNAMHGEANHDKGGRRVYDPASRSGR